MDVKYVTFSGMKSRYSVLANIDPDAQTVLRKSESSASQWPKMQLNQKAQLTKIIDLVFEKQHNLVTNFSYKWRLMAKVAKYESDNIWPNLQLYDMHKLVTKIEIYSRGKNQLIY